LGAPQIIDVRESTPKPWKNGAGVTREIAVEPADATLDDFEWRISVAEIARDAPFSAFAGVDRCIVLLQGCGMQLRTDDGAIDARLDRPLEPFRFAGDVPVTATLIDGPCVDFNVMVRNIRWRAEVFAPNETQHVDAAAAALALCVEGEAFIDSETHPTVTLRTGQAVVWQSAAPSRTLRVGDMPTKVLLVQLHPLCQDAKA
jgi:environmental stress-induced protein Ves